MFKHFFNRAGGGYPLLSWLAANMPDLSYNFLTTETDIVLLTEAGEGIVAD